MVCPKIKVNAFRGYAQKVTIESSTKKSEQRGCDEETIGTYNRQLSTDVESQQVAQVQKLPKRIRFIMLQGIQYLGK